MSLNQVITLHKNIIKILGSYKTEDPVAYTCYLSPFVRLLFFNQALFFQLATISEVIFPQDLNIVNRNSHQLEVLIKKYIQHKVFFPVLKTKAIEQDFFNLRSISFLFHSMRLIFQFRKEQFIHKHFHELTTSTLRLWENCRQVFIQKREEFIKSKTWLPPLARKHASKLPVDKKNVQNNNNNNKLPNTDTYILNTDVPSQLEPNYEGRKEFVQKVDQNHKSGGVENQDPKYLQFIDVKGVEHSPFLGSPDEFLFKPIVINPDDLVTFLEEEKSVEEQFQVIEAHLQQLFGISYNSYDFTPADNYSLSPSLLGGSPESLYELV